MKSSGFLFSFLQRAKLIKLAVYFKKSGKTQPTVQQNLIRIILRQGQALDFIFLPRKFRFMVIFLEYLFHFS